MQNSQVTTTPIVSFIVTYHNENVEMLTECLKSILSLSFAAGEREVILIDDGSDVSPINEIEDFRDDILYLRQPNRGLSEARNAGIDLARGEYIQFVDADDYLIKLSYELCLGLLKRERPDVVVFNFTKEEGDTDAPNLFDGPMTGSEYMRSRNLRACAWGYLFRKNLLISLRFTPGLLHEDEEFTPQLILRAETLYSTDNCAYFYRERENSIVHNNDKEWILKRLDDAEHVIFSLDHLARHIQSRPPGSNTAYVGTCGTTTSCGAAYYGLHI